MVFIIILIYFLVFNCHFLINKRLKLIYYCKKKSISPIRTILFDDDGKAEMSVNMKGGKEFIKKETSSSMGFAIELFCQDQMAARLKTDERKG